MTAAFILTLEVADTSLEMLTQTALELQDALGQDFPVISVQPWARRSQQPSMPALTPQAIQSIPQTTG